MRSSARAFSPQWSGAAPAKRIVAPTRPRPRTGVKTPFPWQKDAARFFIKHGHDALLLDSQGTGKTVSVLISVRNAAQLTPILIVSPASVTESWYRHAREWVSWARPVIIESGKGVVPLGRNIVIVSWDMLYRWARRLRRMNFQLIVADEIHNVRNPKIQRARAFNWLCRQIPRRIGLSGTPIVNSADDLRQIEAYFGRRPPMLRRMLADVKPDMPPKRRVFIDVQLPEVFRAEYRRAEMDFEAWLRDRLGQLQLAQQRTSEQDDEATIARALAAEALVKVGHLRRIIGRGKVAGALDFCSRMARQGEPVVAFAEHQEVVHALARGLTRMRISHAILDGSTRRKDRVSVIDAFQERGETAVLICTQAGREGITLHRARYAVIVERQWTAAVEEQEEDRIWRLGQTRPVSIVLLRVPGTFDERMAEIVDLKRQVLDDAIGGQSVEVAEQQAVLALIQRWDAQVFRPKSQVATLGVTHHALPPLPHIAQVYEFVFSPPWTRQRATQWARLLGYPAMRINVDGKQRVRLLCRPNSAFRNGSLKPVPIARGITAVVGQRAR